MKKILKKNQIIVTALAVLIAVAGYLNYTDNLSKKERRKRQTIIHMTVFIHRIILQMKTVK